MKNFFEKLFIFNFALLIFCRAFASPASNALPEDITFWSDYPAETLAEAIADRMSDEELYAQILMFGWQDAETFTLLNSWVGDRGLGGIKIHEWNSGDLRTLAATIKSLQQKANAGKFKIPLFVATEQEGGGGRHVKGTTSVAPGNLAIAASGYPYDAYYTGYYINREIAILGINMNFAPMVDLYTNKKSTLTGSRSFGENPENAGILGAAFAKGCMDAGVIPVAKHFPGHGDTPSDSRVSLPSVNIDLNTFENRELVPFKYLVKSKIPAIMSGHLSFPKIRVSGEPASLSEFFLTEVLRKNLGFAGLIIADDLTMSGSTLYTNSLSASFRMAIDAGNDILISSTTPQFSEALWTTNLAMMKANSGFKEKVKTAARRVIYEKLKYFKSKNAAPLYPDETRLDEFIPDKDGQVFFLEQACRSITAYKENFLGLKKDNFGKILLCGSEAQFFTSAKERWASAGTVRFNYALTQNEAQTVLNNIYQAAPSYETIIFCVANEMSALVAQNLKPLSTQGKRIIIFSLMSPTLIKDLDWADMILLGYSLSPYTLEALVGACAGEFTPPGTNPVGN